MNDFQVCEKVAFSIDGTCRFGTIAEPSQTGTNYIIDAADGSTWAADSNNIVRLAGGTPLFYIGDRVQVRGDAPHHAGRTGVVVEPAIRDRMLGYRLRLDETGEHVWIPAEALSPLAANGSGGEVR